MTDSGQSDNTSDQEQNGPKPKWNFWPLMRAMVFWCGRRLRRIAEGPNYMSPALTGLATAGIAWLAYWQWAALSNTDISIEKQLSVMHRQLDALEADQRPWISAKLTIASGLTFDDDGGHINFRYDLENSGRSPAFNVFPDPKIVAGTTLRYPSIYPLPLNPNQELKSHCDGIAPMISGALQIGLVISFGYAIFPGKPFSKEEGAYIKFPPTEKPSLNQMFLPPHFTIPTIVVSCVDYQVGTGTAHHQTGDAFYLRRANREKPGETIDVDLSLKEGIPANELSLTPAILGTFAN